ncbi:MAG: terminase large subunit, partial [Gammaproteobacteria bacterium]|nr:terminase large subunit [Gammaproteobacteria bacterium]
MATADRIIRYLSGLTLAGGDHDGQPFTVLRWERRFIRGAFGVEGDAAMTVARGNGKSAVVAGLACAVADPEGPLHGNRREVVCVASSFGQAKIIFEDCLAMLRAKVGLDKSYWRIQDSENRALIEHRASGARIRCIGSDPKRAHGLRPALALLDEPAQWDSAKADRMLAAIRTGLGKSPGSRLIALGTRPSDPTHWFAKMLEHSADYAQSHAAREGDGDFAMRTIRRANPSIDHLPSLMARIIQERDDAKRDETLLASYRALRLNRGTSDVERSLLLSPGTWQRAECHQDPGG